RSRTRSGARRTTEMTSHRETWSDAEIRTMIHFMHHFLNGRFDDYLINVEERERAKTQPSGNTVWSYLLQLQRSFDGWNLGEVCHSQSSCQSKWSKKLKMRLHEVMEMDPEKVLFIYCKLGIKLNTETYLRVKDQFSEYDTIWSGGVLKKYRKRTATVDRRTIDNVQFDIFSSSGEEEEIDSVPTPPSNSPRNEQRRVKREEEREDAVEEKRKKSTTVVKQEETNEDERKEDDVKPNRATLDSIRNHIDLPKKISILSICTLLICTLSLLSLVISVPLIVCAYHFLSDCQYPSHVVRVEF
ncbi:hypothetical protein PENTCL1PPCAC_13320, partial [Pristionchus entomophagus]